MSGIFISYRREDTADVAGRLADALSRHFGEAHVFRDIDAIDPGAEFAKVIAKRIGTCDVLIALIGKDWLQAKDKEGRRRLDQPRDFVAAEIAEALAQRKLVIPALIEGVSMPIHESLPPQIAALADRHATPISDSRFDYDVGRLIVAIERVIKPHTLPEEQTRFTSQELQNRRDLLDDVKREIDDRLAQSLQNDVLIDVFKSKQPYQIQRPWSMEVKIAARRAHRYRQGRT